MPTGAATFIHMTFGLFISPCAASQLFGYLDVFCNHIKGGRQSCPPGISLLDCPAHHECYIPCDQDLQGQWFEVGVHIFRLPCTS